MPIRLTTTLALLLAFSSWAHAQDSKAALNERLWEAARKGQADVVRTLLDQGADVNAKFRYGATALSYASDKGHLEVVKVLLERGADVNVRDTFYGETPISWAASKGHTAIVQALLDKGAEGVDDVLKAGARGGNLDLVRVALGKGGAKPETLTAALVAATKGKQAEIVEMLKKAGAVPPPEIDAATLQSYAGQYKSEQGSVFTVTINEGQLFTAPTGQRPIGLIPSDKTTFRPVDFDGISLTFNLEGDKVTGFTLKQGPNSTPYKRVEVPKP
jgi:hypothetical protein